MADLEKLKALVEKQIMDPKIWAVETATPTEDYLQLQLRKLHAAVEIYAFGKSDPVNWHFINHE